jgi:asparagine synthase (glutamine-hydrolysing)
MHRDGREGTAPHVAADLAVVGDVRLYNAGDVARALGVSDHGDPLPLLAEAFRRWGTGLADRLDGDYAFVVADLANHRVHAFRDPFGVKPLFYWREEDRLLFASEPKQILGLPGVPAAPDEAFVGEFLFQRFEDLTRTYFRGLQRLLPGHRLMATVGDLRIERHWHPDLEEDLGSRDSAAWFDGFRERLVAAVRKRLDTDYPVGSHLSGGLDSGSIAAVLGELNRRGTPGLPRIETLSACYRHPECDETGAILAMAEASGLPNHRFDAEDQPLLADLDEMLWRTDSPFADVGQGSFLETVRVLKGLGARSLLMGFGGDELLDEGHYLYDLGARGRWARVLQDVAEIRRLQASHWTSRRILVETLRQAIPERYKEALRMLRRPKAWTPPEWACPAFVDAFRGLPPVPRLPLQAFASRVQGMTHRDLTHPMNTLLMEFYDAKGAYEGHEVRLPFFDRPLAEYVLRIPFEARIAAPKWKGLVRRGLADLLPREVTEQRRKIALNAYVDHCFGREAPDLARRLRSLEGWASEGIVDREALFEAFAAPLPRPGADDTGYASRAVEELWRPSCLEFWLRTLSRHKLASG